MVTCNRKFEITVAGVSRLIFVCVVLLVVSSCPALAGLRVVVDPRGGDVSAGAKKQLVETASAQIEELEKFYGYRYEHPVWVVLAMDEKSFDDATGGGAPSWAVGIAMRRKVVMRKAGGNFGTPQFAATLKHELSHVLLAEMFAKSPPGALPRWLDEGLAMYSSGQWEMPDDWESDKVELYSALRSGQALSFSEISDSFPFAGWKAKIAYAQSGNFTDYLIRRYGREKVVALLGGLAGGKNIDTAFKAATGETFSDAEYYWRDHIAGRGGLTILLLGVTRFDEYLWAFMAILVVAGFVRYLFKRRSGKGYDGYLDDADYEDDDLYEEWDDETMGYRPWRPRR